VSRAMSRFIHQTFSIIMIVCFVFPNIQPARSAGEAAGRAQAGGKEKITSTVTSYKWQAGEVEFVPGVVLVGLKPGVSLEADKTKRTGRAYITSSAGLATSLDMLQVSSVEGIFPQLPVRGENWTRKSSTSPKQVYRLRLPGISNVRAVAERLALDPAVEFAEPDYIARPAGQEIGSPRNDMGRGFYVGSARPDLLTINDPLYGLQWGLAKIDIEGAWDDTYGSPTVTIAVIDSGIQLDHPDLASQLWVNPGEIGGNGLDDDSNGYIDDVKGWNFVSSNNSVADENGHGTLVAGVAAAEAGNGKGIAGVCPLCRIMPVKVMSSGGTANYSDIAAGVLYAAQKGAKVINISLGGYSDSNTLRNAITAAATSNNAVIAAGAGNDNLNKIFYPAAYPSVLAVAGTKNDDTKADVSNYGTWVDVSAPAVDIRTTALGGDWLNGSGTSMAAPFAAGLAGLLLSLHPVWGQALVRSQIVHTTDTIDSLNPGLEGLLGSGRLDAGIAMQEPHPILSMAGYAVNGEDGGRPKLGATAQMNITLQNDWWDALGVTGTLTTTDTSYVTIINGSAGWGDILAGTSRTNATAFSFSVDIGAGKDHPIPFTLAITDTTGYSNSFDFTVNTETGVVNKFGTLPGDETWTSDKTYLITNTVYIPAGKTLTIQPGTVVKFKGNFVLYVLGTLLADGTSSQPIQFKHNTTGSWDRIFFDDSSTDAVADGSGSYLSGSILRYVTLESSSGGIDCTTATPYLSHVNLSAGGIACSLGATPLWFLDNTISGGASFTGAGNAYRNTISGGLSISGAGSALYNVINGGNLSLGSGTAKRNTITGSLTVGGSAGSIENNYVGGNISAGASFSVLNNTITGNLSAGNGSTVDHNTVSNGISVGSSATVTWNTAEGASGTGLAAGTNITAQYNRLIGNLTGMTATTGLIEYNLIANNTGVGLQVGAATVRYNTLTGNQGNTIVVQGGNPLTLEYNNLEGNTGTYDLYIKIANGVPVLAQNNWWGTTDNPTIDDRIYDYNDNGTKAEVTYPPILSAPDQTAPAYVRGVTVLPDTTLGIQTGTFDVQFSKPMDGNGTPQMSFERSAGLTWNTRASMPTNRDWLGVAAASNGRIYAIGGDMGGSYFPTVEEYDPATNTWSTRADMPTAARAGLGVAAVSNGKIYAIGGYNGSYLATVEEYDPATNTWSTRASMPTARAALGVAAASNGRIYAIGGTDSGGTLATVEEYDPATDMWTTRASMPTARSSLGVATASNGRIFAIGGSSGGIFATVEEYDPATDTWRTRTSMPTARYALGVAAASNGKIYAIGGANGPDYLATMEEYDPVNDIWRTGTSMPTARYSLGVAAASNGKIYAIGGLGIEELATVEEFTPPFETAAFYDPQWSSDTKFRASYDITSLVPRDKYSITVRGATGADGIEIGPNTAFTFTVDYAGSISDKTPPLKPIVSASGNGSLTTLSASWSSSDPESPITMYRYAIGSSSGKRDVVEWTYTTAKSMTRKGLKLTAGVTYYVSAGARNEGGLWSKSGSSNGVVAGAKPGAFNKFSPAKGSVQPTNPLLKWWESSNVVRYEYCIDAEAVNNNVCNSTWKPTGKVTSIKMSGLTANKKYFWQVRAYNLAGTILSGGGWWDFTARNLGSATLRSQGANDGWMLESGENSNSGGSMDATATTFFLGDDANDKQYRGLLSFDTAGLPDDAVFLSAVLKIKKQGLAGSNPFTTHQGLLVDIKKPYFGTGLALAAHDFQTIASKSAVGTFGTTASSGWYSVTLLNTAYPYINKMGTTQFRLRFKLDDDNDNTADYMKFFSGNYGTATDRPVLVIEYYVP